jgi:predicted nucleic acid-binding protein
VSEFVPDASVALRWFLGHPVPAYANRVKRLLLKADRAIVPALWHLEMSSGLIVAERRSILTGADADLAIRYVEQFVAQAVDTDSSAVPSGQTFATARAFQLPTCDAVYLNLARRVRLPLATLDERLRTAAARAGVEAVR